MPTIKESDKKIKLKVHKYYTCERCGYVTIVQNSFCPICAKEGFKIKLK